MRLQNCQLSNIKSGIRLLHTATTHTSPLSPSGTSQTHTETPSPFPPHQQDKVFRKKSVFRAQSSPSPYSQCLANYGLAGLGPKLAGYYLPPFSHACPFLPSFAPHHRRTDRDTHTSFYSLLIDSWVFYLGSTQVTICVWSLHKWPFLQCFFWRDNRDSKVSVTW